MASFRPLTSSEFSFQPNFVEIDGHRIHYVETGQGDPLLFVHGNPTSSYAYRNVLEPVARATGRRAVALDLLGFGKSDKPNLDYDCQLHADIIEGFVRALHLERIVLVAEDWGGFLGTYVMTRNVERFQSAVLMETFLWPMTYEEDADPKMVLPFKLMRSMFGDLFSRGMNMMVEKLIPEHCPISDDALDYYKKSLPTYRSRKALADFPRLIPMNQKPKQSYEFALELQAALPKIEFPVLWITAEPGVIVSKTNPIKMGRLEALQRVWPQMQLQSFGPGFHFLSEEDPERVAQLVSNWVNQLGARAA